MMRAREFVEAELNRDTPSDKVQMNCYVDREVAQKVKKLSGDLGWSQGKVVATAIEAFALLVEEQGHS